jgi:hypothetical protein
LLGIPGRSPEPPVNRLALAFKAFDVLVVALIFTALG